MRVEIGTLVEEQLQHELGADVADVLDDAGLASARTPSVRVVSREDRPRRPCVARARLANLDEPASRSWASAR